MIDCNEIKKISLVSVLEKIGTIKKRETMLEIWYLSPFRDESTASFKVDIKKNLYYDFGEGKGGNIFDIIMRLKNCDFKSALHFLRTEFDSFSFHQSESNLKPIQNRKKENNITKIQDLQNPILINYLKSRCLNVSICKRFLVEVYYELNNKKYFGVGFKNSNGGIEIRNKYVKLCLGKKWYTIIKNNNEKVIVLEGWSDFLSLLTLYPEFERNYDYIILNSLSMLTKLDEVFLSYPEIMFALDNDEAGSKSTKFYIEKWQNSLIDIRFLFAKSKDINDFLFKSKL